MDEIEKEDDPNRVLPGGECEGYPVFHCVTVEGSVVGECGELDEPIERELFRPDQARENLTQECFHCDVASPLDLDQLLQREFGRVRLFQVVPQDTLGLREEPIDRKCVLPAPERGDCIADDPFPADERGKVEPRFDETDDEFRGHAFSEPVRSDRFTDRCDDARGEEVAIPSELTQTRSIHPGLLGVRFLHRGESCLQMRLPCSERSLEDGVPVRSPLHAPCVTKCVVERLFFLRLEVRVETVRPCDQTGKGAECLFWELDPVFFDILRLDQEGCDEGEEEPARPLGPLRLHELLLGRNEADPHLTDPRYYDRLFFRQLITFSTGRILPQRC